VKSFVDAEKALVDSMMKSRSHTRAAAKPAHKVKRPARRAKPAAKATKATRAPKAAHAAAAEA
jgi:hypothetical protein